MVPWDIEWGKGEALHFSKNNGTLLYERRCFVHLPECYRSRLFSDLGLRSCLTKIECLSTFSNYFSFETTGLILIKFHMQHLGNRGSKICSNGLGHMAKMGSIVIYGKNLKKTFFSRTTGFIALKLDM